MMNCFDRDGHQLPDDWSDQQIHGTQYAGATDSRVGKTQVGTEYVSTVWLSFNHNFGYGPPLIFETRIFGERWDHEMVRYSTELDAMRGHIDAVERLLNGKPPFPYLDGPNTV